MGSKTGGNTEPMPFVRKWGAAAASDEPESEVAGPEPPPKIEGERSLDKEEAGPEPPPPSTESSAKRDRSRSRERKKDRERDRDHRRRRSRSRDRERRRSRSRDRDRERRRSRSRSRDRRRRSRSRSRDRKRSRTPEPAVAPMPIVPKEPVINPLLRPEIAAQVAGQGLGIPPSGDGSGLEVAIPEKKRERKSRWSTTKSFVPGMPTILPSNLSEEQRTAYLLNLEIEDATRKLRLGDFGIPTDPAARSPSPEPIYDANGKRLNTREVRKRQELEQFRHEKIQALLKINPNFKPPTDYRAPNVRLHDKVFIPQDLHPELNFVGLLIGPRGNTLKNLEAETGAKIIIRGKGSVKEGKLGSRVGPMPGENEPLHAYVTASDQATIKRACERIRSIINEATAIPDGQNELRKLQLRELALLNGTFRPEDLMNSNHCSNCGSDEHKTWECPNAQNVTAKVVCTNCGSAGHIARDCKMPKGAAAEAMGIAPLMDDEYSALMQELGEAPKVAPATTQPGATAAKPTPQPLFKAGVGFVQPGQNQQYNRPGFPPGFPGPPPPAGQQFGSQSQQQYGGYNNYGGTSTASTNPYKPPEFLTSSIRGRTGTPGYNSTGWYGSQGSMPMPVPPPPPPVGGFAPPPPPPPPPAPAGGAPGRDLSRFLAAAPPPPPPS